VYTDLLDQRNLNNKKLIERGGVYFAPFFMYISLTIQLLIERRRV